MCWIFVFIINVCNEMYLSCLILEGATLTEETLVNKRRKSSNTQTKYSIPKSQTDFILTIACAI